MSTTISGAPMLEEIVEGCLRRAFRSALDAAGMASTRVSCFWLGDEAGVDDVKGQIPPYVFIQAAPCTMPGYREPFRNTQVAVILATLQDDDFSQADSGQATAQSAIPALRNLYKAIRYAVDTEAFAPFDAPVVSYGWTLDDAQLDTGDPRIPMITMTINFRFAVTPSV